MPLSKILLVGDPETRPPLLPGRLRQWGAECRFAASCSEVAALLAAEPFHLILSRMRLVDGNAFDLIPLVAGRLVDLYSYLRARDGYWWLPLARSGVARTAGPAMLDSEFLPHLELFVRNTSAVVSQVTSDASDE